MKTAALSLSASLLLAGCFWGTTAVQRTPTAVSAINVSADLQAVGDAASVRYWQTLEQDLEAALVTEFLGRVDPSGAIVDVDVDEIALADALRAGMTGADARLSGAVDVTDPRDGAALGAYTITATAREAASVLAEDTGAETLTPDSGEFYAALVEAFARGVAQAVLQQPQTTPSVSPAQL